VVNIQGTGAASADGLQAIGLRADIDALPMPENNHDLEYRSKTNHAHMCGHDGHTATLIATARVL